MKIIILIFIALLNLFLWNGNAMDLDTIYFLLPLASIIISIAFVLPKIYRGKIKLKLLYFLLLGILYFNTPLYFLALLDKQELLDTLLQQHISIDTFIKANALLGVSLPLIIVGYLLAYQVKTRRNNKTSSSISFPIKKTPFLFFFIIFFALSLSVTGLTIGASFVGVSSYYYILLLRITIILCVIVIFNSLIYNKFNLNFRFIFKKNILTIFSIFLFIIYVLIGGDRGPALILILMLAFGYLLIKKMKIKISTFLFSIGFLILLNTFFVFIEVLRQNNSETISISTIEQSIDAYKDYEKKSSSTILTTTLAIEGIENGLYPHSYGLFMIQSLVRGVPFFGTLIIKNTLGENFFDGTADLITTQHSGVGYTSGLGTSYLADTYIEFGLIGIIIISFFYGLIVGSFDAKCANNSFKNFSELLLISIFVGYSFYVGRGTLFGFLVNFMHTWIYYMIIRYLLTNIFGYNFNKKIKWKD